MNPPRLDEKVHATTPTRNPEEPLYITHGQFIHAAGDGIEYVIQQLIEKPDGNRAILSLIKMEDIIHSGDDPIPSFLLLQFGRRNGGELLCTAYFRALEVIEFLPINITEIGLIVEQIYHAIPTLKEVQLSIHAFRAYAREEFDCLEKADLDLASGYDIVKAVIDADTEQIREWLEGKSVQSTAVETSGLDDLLQAVEKERKQSGEFSERFVRHLREVVEHLHTYHDLRKRTSHSEAVKSASSEYRKSLNRALSELNKGNP